MTTTLSRNTIAALAKYGEPTCREAFKRNTVDGEGASTIALTMPGVKTTQQADAAINAGAELAEREKGGTVDVRIVDENSRKRTVAVRMERATDVLKNRNGYLGLHNEIQALEAKLEEMKTAREKWYQALTDSDNTNESRALCGLIWDEAKAERTTARILATRKANESPAPAGEWCDGHDANGRPVRMFIPAKGGSR